MTTVALLHLSLWWPVAFFGQVAGLGQTARVQRGPSQAARCASNGTGPAALPILSSHRPPLLVPRHLPEHPLISRADHERLLHPPLLFFARRLGPLIYFAPHPALHLGKFR